VTALLGAAIFWIVSGTMHFVIPRSTRQSSLHTLLAVYPANIHMAVNAKDFPKIPAAALWVRLPVQGLFALLTWRGTR
jgi:uncharacterized membrane protein